jgi:hypothetical protein
VAEQVQQNSDREVSWLAGRLLALRAWDLPKRTEIYESKGQKSTSVRNKGEILGACTCNERIQKR